MARKRSRRPRPARRASGTRKRTPGADVEGSLGLLLVCALLFGMFGPVPSPPADWRANSWDLGDYPAGTAADDWIEHVSQPTPAGVGADFVSATNPGSEGGTCSDGLDGDGDGLTDAEDPDCLSMGVNACWAGYYQNDITATTIGGCGTSPFTLPPTWTPACDPAAPMPGVPWDFTCDGSTSIIATSPDSPQWCNHLTFWPALDEGTKWFGPGSRTDSTGPLGLAWTTAMPMPMAPPTWTGQGFDFPGQMVGSAGMQPCGGWIDSAGPHYDADGDGY